MVSLKIIHLLSMESIINCRMNIKKTGQISLKHLWELIERFINWAEFAIRIIQQFYVELM
jgi:hypothetical protein